MFAGSWFLIPFSILWGGFAIFWEIGVILSGAPIFFWLWGIPFVLVGLYMIGGRFLVARREALRTWYVITSQRLVISSGAFRTRTVELDLTNLPPTELSQARNGTGTISFGQTSAYERMSGFAWWGMGAARPAFVAIRDADRVLEAISDARAEAMRAAFGTPAR